MKKRSIIVLTLLAGCFTNSFAQERKTLTVEVSNEWTQNKTDEPIVIDLNNLRKQVSTSNPPLYGKVIKNSVPTGRSER